MVRAACVDVCNLSGGYFGLGSSMVKKNNGKLAFSTRLILLFWLAGQRFSCNYYSRRCAAWNAVTANVLIGRLLDDAEAEQCLSAGVTAVVDLTCEFSEAAAFISLGEKYLNVPILDLTAPSVPVLDGIADFIISEARQGIVYVHCKIGYSRSVSAVGAYLLKSGQAPTVDAAVEMIRRARPSVVVRPEIWQALGDYRRVLASNGSIHGVDIRS